MNQCAVHLVLSHITIVNCLEHVTFLNLRFLNVKKLLYTVSCIYYVLWKRNSWIFVFCEIGNVAKCLVQSLVSDVDSSVYMYFLPENSFKMTMNIREGWGKSAFHR